MLADCTARSGFSGNHTVPLIPFTRNGRSYLTNALIGARTSIAWIALVLEGEDTDSTRRDAEAE
jgi:hypothetical protein